MSASTSSEGMESSSIRTGSVPEVPDEEFRRLIRQVIPNLLDRFEVFCELPFSCGPPPFLSRHFFPDLTSAIYIASYCSMDQWRPFFDKHYERMSSTSNLYMQYVFYVLDRYESHFSGVFDCLLSSMVFVTTATVFFATNGCVTALRCPYRILFHFFESRLRDRFYSQGGFAGLYKHMEVVRIYKIMHFRFYNVEQLEYPPWVVCGGRALADAYLQYLPRLDDIEGSVVESHEISATRSAVAMEIDAYVSARKRKSQKQSWMLRDDEVIENFQKYVKAETRGDVSSVPPSFASIIPPTSPKSLTEELLATPGVELPVFRIRPEPLRPGIRRTPTSGGKVEYIAPIGYPREDVPSDSSEAPPTRGLVGQAFLSEIEKAIGDIKMNHGIIKKVFIYLTVQCGKSV